MNNDLYRENKRLLREVGELRDRLQERENREALPKMLEGVLFSFFRGHAEFVISRTEPAWRVRFHVDAPPAPPRQPSDAS